MDEYRLGMLCGKSDSGLGGARLEDDWRSLRRRVSVVVGLHLVETRLVLDFVNLLGIFWGSYATSRSLSNT